MGIVCIRSRPQDTVSATSQSPAMPMSFENMNASGVLPSSSERFGPHDASLSYEARSFQHPSVVNQGEEIPIRMPSANDSTPQTATLGQMPQGKELKDLVQLYFSSVHQFGFLTFVHEYHFNRLLAKGTAPRELTLMMIASAMRFGSSNVTSHDLARADAWADAAINALLPRVYRGFGAIHLMALLLAHHYDLNRNYFSSAWLLGATCTRMMQMMSLQTLDSGHRNQRPAHLSLSPLLSQEALRRMAWSTFYLDTIVDGGRWGFHTVDENTFRIQLPCDQASFLVNEPVTTEPLEAVLTSPGNTNQADHMSLDMSAYLLRTAAMRRRALHFAFRTSYGEEPEEEVTAKLVALENDVEKVVYALPKRFQFSFDNMILHRDRLATFILLHILRHNLYIILGRAALQVYRGNSAKADLLQLVRRDRISHALPIAGLVSEGLKAGISFDPQMGVHAYVSLEILLFEPRRLAKDDPSVDPQTPEIVGAMSQLLTTIRKIAARSEFVKHLYIEALYRLQKCDYMQLLEDVDVAALRSFLNEYHHLVGQETDEYDFRDFRWAKLERLRRAPWIAANATHDEALLEDKSGGVETAVTQDGYDSRIPSPSPRLDAMYVENNPLSYASNARWPVENANTDPTTTNTAPSNIALDADESHYEDVLTQESESWSTLNEFEIPGSTFIPGDLFWPLDEFRNW
ncbi:hypothetical protein DPV78_009190 [Talaromyces pinophilus]|nr:hypothetical protein DPV78_009190 [Talaromyces pinophilus]